LCCVASGDVYSFATGMPTPFKTRRLYRLWRCPLVRLHSPSHLPSCTRPAAFAPSHRNTASNRVRYLPHLRSRDIHITFNACSNDRQGTWLWTRCHRAALCLSSSAFWNRVARDDPGGSTPALFPRSFCELSGGPSVATRVSRIVLPLSPLAWLPT